MAQRYTTLPEITPSQLKKLLKVLDQMDNPPALMVYGPPGVGKTTILKQFAEEKKYELRVLHLSRMDPSDWSGIPRQNRNYTEFLPISLFKPARKRGKKPVKIVVFFDELNTATPQVLNAALDVLLEKRSDHANAKLPDNTIIVAAGNLGEEDGTYVEHLSSAVRTRLIQVRLRVDVQEWLNWARQNHIHPAVIEFISTHRNGLYPLLDMEGLRQDHDQVATPRGWERVSQILYAFSQTVHASEKDNGNHLTILEKLIVGTIGESTGSKFAKFFIEHWWVDPIETSSIQILEDTIAEFAYEGKLPVVLRFITFANRLLKQSHQNNSNNRKDIEDAIFFGLTRLFQNFQNGGKDVLVALRGVSEISAFLRWLRPRTQPQQVQNLLKRVSTKYNVDFSISEKELAAFLKRVLKELQASR